MPRAAKSKPAPRATKVGAKTSKSRAMPKFTRAPDSLVQAFGRAMQDFPMAEQRKMFGYPAAFVNGQMFAGLFGDRMMLRLSESDRAKFMAKFETGLFEPMPGRPMKEYVLVPSAVLQAPAALRIWLNRALDYARSLPPKRKTR
jgi:TfoX/Sxy family transcriptional regulator of competence genes